MKYAACLVAIILLTITSAAFAVIRVPATSDDGTPQPMAQAAAPRPAPRVEARDSSSDDYFGHIQLHVRYWFSSLSGKTSLVRDLSENKVDLNDELGVGDEGLPDVRLRLNFNDKHGIQASYTKLDFRGDKTLIKGLIIDDAPTGIANRIKTKLDVDYFRLGWRWNVVGHEGSSDPVRLQTIVDAAVFNLDSNYKMSKPYLPGTTTRTESASGIGGLPVLGLNMTIVPVGPVEVYGEVSGMYAGKYGHLFDSEVGARVSPFRNLFLEGGYRYLGFKAEYDKDEANINVSGPFVGAGVRF